MPRRWRRASILDRRGARDDLARGSALPRRSAGRARVAAARPGRAGRARAVRRVGDRASNPAAVLRVAPFSTCTASTFDTRASRRPARGGQVPEVDLGPTSGIRPTRWMIRPPTVSYALHRAPRHRSARKVAEVVHGDPTVEPKARRSASVSTGDDEALLDVVLVLDVTDDLLDQVLDGDQAGGPAVLVDDDRDVPADASRSASRPPASSRARSRGPGQARMSIGSPGRRRTGGGTAAGPWRRMPTMLSRFSR